jgi:hypothetical protein
VLFNFGDAVREPALTDQFYSLYNFLETNGGQSTISGFAYHATVCASGRAPMKAAWSRRSLASGWSSGPASFTTSLAGRLSMSGWTWCRNLLPNLTPIQQNELEQTLQAMAPMS